MINKFIGNYRLSNFLGHGPGIEVYRATHADAPETRYRVKRVLRNGVASQAFFDAFVSLAQRVSPLEHPKVLRIAEILFDDTSAYLVGEDIQGQQPLSLLAEPKGIIPIRHVLGLFKQTADALAAAHAVGLLHGGATAERVLCSHERHVKVEDFGLAPLLRNLGLPGGQIPAGYIAPEVAPGDPPSVSSEVFSLGALLIHLLIGRSPDPVMEGEGSLASQLQEIRPGLPARLLELVRRLTAANPEERFRSVDEPRDLATDCTEEGRLVQIELGKALSRKPSARGEPAEPDRPFSDWPEMVPIPEGSFRMGSGRRKNESPVREIDLPAFKIAAYPTTNRQYRRFCDETGYARPEDPPGWGRYFEEYPDHPVVNVRWSDAPNYCNWLSKLAGSEYRLPTEAEWEKAARGGLEGEAYPWGTEDPDERAHFGGRAYAWEIEMQGPKTRRLASFAPNGYGLYDMAGNVWEWCQDWYMPYGTAQPRGGVFRVARGGSWSVEEDAIRCSFRMSLYTKTCDFFTGFRVCAT
jgi:formylglycine-generating enzyme required for sulfatase activity